MKITEILTKDFIIPEFKSDTKTGIINELVDLFKDDPRVISLDQVRDAVLQREKIMSTGVGKGFGLPHGKTEGVKEILAAFGISKKPVQYQSLDNLPVNLVFLLVGKENMVSSHIKLLSRISRMMNKDEFRENLLAAKDAGEIFRLFKTEEESYIDL
jgi:mannitol/fructose-specific phosphotransferase system IIA component (Ntr-type)